MKINAPAKILLALSLLGAILIITLGTPELSKPNLVETYVQFSSLEDENNVIEISNSSVNSEKVYLEFYNSKGLATESITTLLKPNEKKDILVNGLKSYKVETNYIVKLQSYSKNITAKLNNYILNKENKSIASSYSLNFIGKLTNSSVNHYDQKNYLDNTFSQNNSIYISNLSSSKEIFNISIYSSSGSLIDNLVTPVLGEYKSIAISSSKLDAKNSYGLIRITPKGNNSSYLASIKKASLKSRNASYFRASQSKDYQVLPIMFGSLNSILTADTKIKITNNDELSNYFAIQAFNDSGISIFREEFPINRLQTVEFNFSKYSKLIKGSTQLLISSASKSYLSEAVVVIKNSKDLTPVHSYSISGQSNQEFQSISNFSWDIDLTNLHVLQLYNPYPKPISVNLQFTGKSGNKYNQSKYISAYGSQRIEITLSELVKLNLTVANVKIDSPILVELIKARSSENNINFINYSNNYSSRTNNFEKYGSDLNQAIKQNENTNSGLQTNEYGAKDLKITDQELKNLVLAGNYFRVNGAITPVNISSIEVSKGIGMEIIPHEIRSTNYKSTANNTTLKKYTDYITTFFKFRNETAQNYGRITLIETPDGPRISGLLVIQGQRYSIRPHILDITGKTLMLTESSKTQFDKNLPSCAAKSNKDPINSIIEDTKKGLEKSRSQLGGSTQKIIEVATDADYERVKYHGSDSAVNAFSLGILNEIDGLYKNELGIGVKVVFQNAWTTANDPYNAQYNHDRITELESYWNANFRSKQNYDYAHLFTASPYTYAAGNATLGGICGSGSYGETTIVSWWPRTFEITAIMHEMGHALGADHDNCSSTDALVMCANTVLERRKFSDLSKNVIKATSDKMKCLTYLGKNNPPTIAQLADQTLKLPNSLTVPLNVSDADGDTFTTSVFSGYGKVSADGKFYQVDSQSYMVGTKKVTIQSKDTKDGVSTMSFNLTVTENKPPYIENVLNLLTNFSVGSSLEIKTQQELKLKVFAKDPENLQLNYTIKNLPNGASFSNQTLTWIPKDSNVGNNNIEFLVSDGENAPVSRPLSIIVKSGNRAPVINYIGDKTIDAGKNVSFVVSAVDPDGDSFTLKQDTTLSGSTFNNGNFSWTPRYEEIGTKTITFSATDSKNNTSSINVKIIVTKPSNLPPTFANIGKQTIEVGKTLTFTVSATDPEGGKVTIILNNAELGTSFNNNTFSWTPGESQIKNYSFRFTASDPESNRTDKYVDVEVLKSSNYPPYISAFYDATNGGLPLVTAPNKTLKVGTFVKIEVRGEDVDKDVLSYSVTNSPVNATFADRMFSWTPNASDVGTKIVKFGVSDGKGGSDSRDFTFTVTPNSGNNPPVFTNLSDKNAVIGLLLEFTISATDPEGDSVSILADSIPNDSTFKSNKFSWTPKQGQNNVTVSFSATDSKGAKTQSNFKIFVSQNSNRPPVLNTIGTKTGSVGQKITFSLSATDPDNDPISFSAQNLQNGANLTGKDFQWTPAANQSGTFSMKFIVTDSKGASTYEVVSFNISANATPWQNPVNKYDVTNDGYVAPTDALMVINRMNGVGMGPLTGIPNFANGEGYYDVDGNNVLSPTDALMVINYLNDMRN